MGYEVVDKLHKEFLLKDLKPDVEQPSQTVADHGHPVAPAAIDPQGRCPCGPFADFSREGTYLDDAFFVQKVDLPLQSRDQPGLQRNQGAGRQPECDGLEKQKAQDRQHLARLQDRLGNGVSHQPAHRFTFGSDHADQFALASAFEIGLRKAQDARDQLVAQPPQQPLGQHALHGVDAHFHKAMHQHCQQESKAEHHQILNLCKLDAECVDRCGS